MKYDAFISYRRSSGFPMARVIRDKLLEYGIKCYLDLEEDKAGKFDEDLLHAIESAPNFILVLPKNALNRCVKENDWVRREIVTAVKSGRTVIPLLFPDFKWPEKIEEQLPEEIIGLKYQQGVLLSQEYLSATLEKLISYMTDIEKLPVKNSSRNAVPLGAAAFFKAGMEDPGFSCIDMAFHAGAEWRRAADKVDLLTYLISNKITLRVIVNSAEVAKPVCDHMAQPLKKYVGFDNCVADWKELEKVYPETVHVKVAKVPLLHRLYITRNSDGSGAVNVKYYTYGNYTPDKDCRRSFDSSDPEYKLYTDEFDYLWENACEE